MKIGIFGGTFNPIHIAHLIIGEWIKEEFNLDKFYFIPTANPPHKFEKSIIDAEHRFKMVKLSIEENPYLDVSDFEMKKENSYSIDTIKHFKNRFDLDKPDLFFIIGQDNLAQIDSWKSPEKIFELCTVVVVRRSFNKSQQNLKINTNKYSDLVISQAPYLELSSTMIRKRIKAGKSVKYLVPAGINNYIKKYNLFV